ncbi:MAG: HIT domain-containing protein [Candidatus Aenigmarchaeota archaeon]|nr:HIT domain-containing protein [Candidatus Aenigmarchaeota archaeon]
MEILKKYEEGCAHCPGGIGLQYPLSKDKILQVVCDVHPLVQGHILIIPKEHISCMGNLPDEKFARYEELYNKVKHFVSEYYGPTAVFEHGVTGQTVFHAHTHFFPYKGTTNSIIPQDYALKKIDSFHDIKKEFDEKNKYLFLENNNEMYMVDTDLGYPRFFREIFAKLLNVEERANWKKTMENEELMRQFKTDIKELTAKWRKYNK